MSSIVSGHVWRTNHLGKGRDYGLLWLVCDGDAVQVETGLVRVDVR